jgi:hypothetical protein
MIHYPLRIRRINDFFLGALLLVGALDQVPTAQAQLIGNRTVGSAPGNIQQTSPSGRIGAGSFTNAAPGAGPIGANGLNVGNNPGGGISQNGRFVRGNRQRGDFVGSNRTDLKGFVGAGQAVGIGNAPSATSNLRLETSGQRVNRPLPPLPKKSMYYPKLVLEDSDTSRREVIRSPEYRTEVQDRLRRSGYPQVQVDWNAGVVVLSGQVASEREREMAETLLSFEPGISEIRNQLLINPTHSLDGESMKPNVHRKENRSSGEPVLPLPEPVLPRKF